MTPPPYISLTHLNNNLRNQQIKSILTTLPVNGSEKDIPCVKLCFTYESFSFNDIRINHYPLISI